MAGGHFGAGQGVLVLRHELTGKVRVSDQAAQQLAVDSGGAFGRGGGVDVVHHHRVTGITARFAGGAVGEGVLLHQRMQGVAAAPGLHLLRAAGGTRF